MKRLQALALSTLAAVALLSATGADARPARMCPTIYRPVCAVTPMGQRKTFSNACVAHRAHARILYNGRCRPRR